MSQYLRRISTRGRRTGRETNQRDYSFVAVVRSPKGGARDAFPVHSHRDRALLVLAVIVVVAAAAVVAIVVVLAGPALRTHCRTHRDYVAAAADAASLLYGYGHGPVLFKPTKAAEHQFRPTGNEAMS